MGDAGRTRGAAARAALGVVQSRRGSSSSGQGSREGSAGFEATACSGAGGRSPRWGHSGRLMLSPPGVCTWLFQPVLTAAIDSDLPFFEGIPALPPVLPPDGPWGITLCLVPVSSSWGSPGGAFSPLLPPAQPVHRHGVGSVTANCSQPLHLAASASRCSCVPGTGSTLI